MGIKDDAITYRQLRVSGKSVQREPSAEPGTITV